MGERRDLNPRVMESQSIALPLGYARHNFNLLKQFFYEGLTEENQTLLRNELIY